MKNRMIGLCFFIFDLLFNYFIWMSVAAIIISPFVFKDSPRNIVEVCLIMIPVGMLSWYLRRKLRAYKIHLIEKGVLVPKPENHRPY